MTSTFAPSYFFTGINFNSSFYSESNSVSSNYYLKRTVADTALGTITFNNGLNSSNIQPLTAATTTNLFTTNTGTINTGGTGNYNINSDILNLNGTTQLNLTGIRTVINGETRAGTTGNYYVEMANGGTSGTLIDFHSGNNSNSDFDSRIISTGGSASPSTSSGQGTLSVQAATLNLGTTAVTTNINMGVAGTTNTINGGTTYISRNGNYTLEVTNATTSGIHLDFHSSNTSSNYDARLTTSGGSATTGQGTLDILASTINIGTATGTNTLNGLTNIGTNGSYNIECNTNSSGCFIDFHSGTGVNYDSRIISTGGSVTTGSGNLDILATNINVGLTTGTTNLNGLTYLAKNGNYNVECWSNASGCMLDFHSSNITNDFDSRISATGGNATDGAGTLEMKASLIKITGQVQFSNYLTNQGGGIGKAFGTIYQNFGYNARFICVSASGTGSIKALTDPATPPTAQVAMSTLGGATQTISFYVCANSYYQIVISGTPTLVSWTEWF